MKIVNGDTTDSRNCGWQVHSFLVVSKAQEAAVKAVGGMKVPSGSCHYDATGLLVEQNSIGYVTDIQIVMNPTQMFWDDCYDEQVAIPREGHTISWLPIGEWLQLAPPAAVQTHDRAWYVSRTTKAALYGFRLGGLKEAVKRIKRQVKKDTELAV